MHLQSAQNRLFPITPHLQNPIKFPQPLNIAG